jgi:hypothetical protein
MMEFTLKEAKEYAVSGKIEEWVIQFVSATDNERLGKVIQNYKGKWEGPKEFDLNKLKRRVGPEEGMSYPEPKDVFDSKVNGIISRIDNGWDIPPLIFWESEDGLSLMDGGHRLEALKRASFKKYWIIIWHADVKEFR